MTLEGFKGIFWWEYLHRLLARVIGLVFLLPLLYFQLAKKLGVTDVHTSVAAGDPAEVVLDAAKLLGADLLKRVSAELPADAVRAESRMLDGEVILK
mgnify:CR=1 FL=1